MPVSRPLPHLLLIALTGGLLQAAAGVAMYVGGVYFAPWSMGVSIAVLLLCIVVGTRWHGRAHPEATAGFGRAFRTGVVIAAGTGILYALYNVVTISWVYPDFLAEVRSVQMEAATRMQLGAEAYDRINGITMGQIALGNLIRLTVGGTLLAALTAPFTRTRVAP